MAIQNFDKLNILKQRSMPYEEYFGDMLISSEQKQNRKNTALILEDIISIFFEILYTEILMNQLNAVNVKQQLAYDLYETIDDENFFDDEDQFEDYLVTILNELVDNTIKNLQKSPNDYDYTGTKPYWVSDDRAKFVAENEANTLWNNKEFTMAIKSGKTHKIWRAYPDNRVRKDHVQTNGSKIPINAYFTVGPARMLFPKDITSEFSTGAEYPEEVINCRCVVDYI